MLEGTWKTYSKKSLVQIPTELGDKWAGKDGKGGEKLATISQLQINNC
jgi:hypothetical protein